MVFRYKFSGLIPAKCSITTLLVLLFLSGNSYASMLLDRVVAVVNKEVITWSELHRAMEFEVTVDMKSLSDAEKSRIFKENEAVFLESMIDKKLQLQAAKNLDIDVSKEEIAESVEGVRKKYSMSEEEFNRSLKKEGFTLEEYKKRLAEQIILSKVIGQQVRNKIVISEDELKDYMSKNKDASFRVRQIFFKKPEKDIDRKAVEAKAEEIFNKLKAGEDFPMIAARFSEDPSGKAGGDLGLIKKEYLAKEFVEALSRMNVGDVSQPFWTSKGLHIIKLEEKIDARNMDEFKEALRKKLFEIRFNEAYKSWVRSLRERALVDIKL